MCRVTLYECGSHCLCPVFIIIVITLQQVRKKEELHHGKKQKQLDEYERPQRFADGHASESVVIKTKYLDRQCSHVFQSHTCEVTMRRASS